jgi:hypothetical protein
MPVELDGDDGGGIFVVGLDSEIVLASVVRTLSSCGSILAGVVTVALMTMRRQDFPESLWVAHQAGVPLNFA